MCYGLLAHRRVRMGQRPELVVLVLEQVDVDPADPHTVRLSVSTKCGVVVDPVPRDVQRDARCSTGERVHLGDVGTLLVRVPGYPRGGEHLEPRARVAERPRGDRQSTRLNSSHVAISYAVFCSK